MPDQKLSLLPAITSLSNNDIFYVVDNPESTDLSAKIAWLDIKKSMYGLALVNHTDYTASANDLVILQSGSMVSPITITLPPAYTTPPGYRITVGDIHGSVDATNTITMIGTGSDTVVGSFLIRNAFGMLNFYSNGSNKWLAAVGGSLAALNDLSDLANIVTARANLGVDTVSRVKLNYAGFY